MSSKKILQIALPSIFFLLIVAYGLWGSHNLIFGIKIKNVNIDNAPAAEEMKIEKAVIEVTGNAKNAINLVLNGREISINQTGDFNETIALLPGYNIVEIKAKDKFGYIDKRDYQLTYEAVIAE